MACPHCGLETTLYVPHVPRAEPDCKLYRGPQPPVVAPRKPVNVRKGLKIALIVWTCLCASYAGLTLLLMLWEEFRGRGGLRSADEMTSAGTLIGYCMALATMFAGWAMGAIPLALVWMVCGKEKA